MKSVTGLWLLVGLLMTGCGGGSSKADPPSGGGPISGNWQMSLEKTSTMTRTQSGFLLENGKAVSGSLIFAGTVCAGIGSVSGTLNGSDVSLSVDPTGLSIDLTGTVGSNKASMSGTYVMLASGCGKPETGTWTAELVKPLNGSFQGSFVSTRSGTTFPVSAQITQGSNAGTASAFLAGTLTITGSSCFATANISGLVSGTSLVINFGDTDNAQVGQVTATSTADGASLSGNYSIPLHGAAGSPCRAGDIGTVTLTM